MIDVTLREHLREVAMAGYGYPEDVLIWRDHVAEEHWAAVHAWARREGHHYIELIEPLSGSTRAFWLVPRDALAS